MRFYLVNPALNKQLQEISVFGDCGALATTVDLF